MSHDSYIKLLEKIPLPTLVDVKHLLSHAFVIYLFATPAYPQRKDNAMNSNPAPVTRRQEWRTFLLLTVVLIPLLSLMIVAGYGFSVWILQMLFGPPGHG